MWTKNSNAPADFSAYNNATDLMVTYSPALCSDESNACQPWQGGSNPCDPTGPTGLNIVCQECALILPNVEGLNKATLRVDGVEGGVAPFTYLWSTGETTQSIKVNPSVTTVYTVTVTDAHGLTGVRTIPVTAVQNATCGGNKKVLVCYSPPDHPDQWKEACVDPKKVGSYVPKLRYSGNGSLKGSNKHQSIKVHGSSNKVKLPSVKLPSHHGSKVKNVGGSHLAKVKSVKGSVRGSGSSKGSLKAGSLKHPKGGSHAAHYGSHQGSKNKIKSVKKAKGGSKAGSGAGIGTLRGAVGPCGSNGPVNNDACGN